MGEETNEDEGDLSCYGVRPLTSTKLLRIMIALVKKREAL